MTKESHVQQPQKTYADYLKEAIIETVSGLSDEKKLNYIYTMVMGAVAAEMMPADY